MLPIALILLCMNADNAVSTEQCRINQKTYLVAKFNLFGCEKYLLPKLDNAPVHHTFFSPKDINQLYESKNIDPQNLDCNLKFKLQEPCSNKPQLMIKKSSQSEPKLQAMVKPNTEVKATIKRRPKMRESGFTHFIHVPLVEQLKEIFVNQIRPQIEAEDEEYLLDLEQLHCTLMAFRIRSLDDLPHWELVLREAKKTKVIIKGVDIFAVKGNYARVLYLNIKGLEDMLDSIVSKAIEKNLIKEQELDKISFDKATQTFRAHKMHVTLLKTKGKDLFDATQYLKAFSKINLTKISANQVKMSMIGTFDGKDFFNELQVPL